VFPEGLPGVNKFTKWKKSLYTKEIPVLISLKKNLIKKKYHNKNVLLILK
jgi:hypothetical protein